MLRGSVALFWPHCLHSSRCGSPNKSTMNLGPASCNESVRSNSHNVTIILRIDTNTIIVPFYLFSCLPGSASFSLCCAHGYTKDETVLSVEYFALALVVVVPLMWGVVPLLFALCRAH